MKNKAIKLGIIATIAPHIFCCGIPMTLAIIGLIAPDMAHFHILPHWMEPWLFVFSGIMLLISWLLVFRDCECECKHCDSKKSHKTQKILIGIISVIFIISLVLHFISHH
jgi:SNF family Na+-dependent transporter